MSFLPKEPTTFINIKLTDAGRRLLSLGRLTFDKAALSDREMNYSVDRTGFYNIENNRVLSPRITILHLEIWMGVISCNYKAIMYFL